MKFNKLNFSEILFVVFIIFLSVDICIRSFNEETQYRNDSIKKEDSVVVEGKITKIDKEIYIREHRNYKLIGKSFAINMSSRFIGRRSYKTSWAYDREIMYTYIANGKKYTGNDQYITNQENQINSLKVGDKITILYDKNNVEHSKIGDYRYVIGLGEIIRLVGYSSVPIVFYIFKITKGSVYKF